MHQRNEYCDREIALTIGENMLKKLNFCYGFSKFTHSIKVAMLLLGILLSLSGCERIKAPMLPDDGSLDTEPLTVMTYNVYVGADMIPLLGITNLLEVPGAVAGLYDTVIASDFPGRAAAIATGIKAHQPHLIALQEISLIRTQTPGDRLTGGEPAEEVVLDFLEVLMDALQTAGLKLSSRRESRKF